MISKKAFTLVELIIYVGIISIALITITSFTWSIIDSDVRVDVSSELTQNGRLVLEKITQEIHQAEDVITASSTFDTHPGVLTLDMAGVGTDVIFDTYTTSVDVGGQSITIRKLRMKDGANPYYDLTSDEMDVTNFVLTNLTRDTEPPNINIEITLDYVDTGDDASRANKEVSFETAVSIREK